jgi:hypothetical protein
VTTAFAALSLFLRHDLAACVAVHIVFAGMAAFRLFGHYERELAIAATASGLARTALWLLRPKRTATVVATSASGNGRISERAKRRIDGLATTAGLRSIDIVLTENSDASHPIWQPNGTIDRHAPTWQCVLRPEEANGTPYKICATFEQTALILPRASLAAVALLREFAVPIAVQMANGKPETIPMMPWNSVQDDGDASELENRRAA